MDAAGFDEADRVKIAEVLVTLGAAFVAEDATLVEVNPLVKTGSGQILAADGKVTLTTTPTSGIPIMPG